MSGFLPLFIDLRDQKVVIIGGGSVGERKAALFGRYAKTVVVSFEFTERLMELEDIELITMDEKLDDDEFAEMIDDAFLVIPATDDLAYNEHLSDIASRHGVLVNRVDDLGDVIIPSVIARGDIVIGISTLAHSPALSRYIRGADRGSGYTCVCGHGKTAKRGARVPERQDSGPGNPAAGIVGYSRG